MININDNYLPVRVVLVLWQQVVLVAVLLQTTPKITFFILFYFYKHYNSLILNY